MSADFWAGYISGAIGIIIGNPLDLIKVRLQASGPAEISVSPRQLARFDSVTSLVRGAAAPILGYGALNALLFVSYNRSLMLLDSSVTDPTNPQNSALYKLWLAGALGGAASWAVSSPTEFIKCRAQLDTRSGVSSWAIAKDIVRTRGWKGLYFAGGVTCARDSIGYGFYFWSYEYCKRLMSSNGDEDASILALKVLLCGGIAGIVTWASVFPLDVIKTRLQAKSIEASAEAHPLLQSPSGTQHQGAFTMARYIYQTEGLKPFYRGLGVCSLRAFIVNAAQWATYEWLIKYFQGPALGQPLKDIS
ncbi:mitochondrial carrier domain-containing protein [Aspergillus granulosus]|uniref:Mitochondrial carrier domain-containing protein n=1 Tax=Aspergillus granulosus TaxID=176169 RepID=A0ABR4H4Y6_9EURO